MYLHFNDHIETKILFHVMGKNIFVLSHWPNSCLITRTYVSNLKKSEEAHDLNDPIHCFETLSLLNL